jgi:hypothetical protein
VLVVVLVLEWAGKLGAERSCQLIATPLDLCMVSPANVDREKLDVYQLELKFLTWVSQFLADLSGPLSAQTRELREQLNRASLLIREAKSSRANPRRKTRFSSIVIRKKPFQTTSIGQWGSASRNALPYILLRTRLSRMTIIPSSVLVRIKRPTP